MLHKSPTVCAAFDCAKLASAEYTDGLGRRYCSQSCLDEYTERQRIAQEMRALAGGNRLGEGAIG